MYARNLSRLLLHTLAGAALIAAVGCSDSTGPDETAIRVRNFPVSFSELRAALERARGEQNGGLNLDMWATIVDRDGKVIAVAFTETAGAISGPGAG
jgi:hypothetical protein